VTMDFEGVGIVLVNYGSVDQISESFNHPERFPGANVVVVDNFTTEAERSSVLARAIENQWLALTPETNTGFGAGCNLGVEAARRAGCDRILLINPDADIDTVSASLLLDAVDDDPMTLAGPRILKPDGSLWSAGMDLDLDTGDMRPWRVRDEYPNSATMPWLSGACLMLSIELFDAVGGFDESYFLYWEDVDLCARVIAAGGNLQVVDGAVATHAVGGTQGQGKSETYYYYNIVNRARFAVGHLEPADRQRWRRSAPKSAWRIVRRGGRRQFVRSLAPWRAWWRGLRDSDYLAN